MVEEISANSGEPVSLTIRMNFWKLATIGVSGATASMEVAMIKVAELDLQQLDETVEGVEGRACRDVAQDLYSAAPGNDIPETKAYDGVM